MYNEEIIEKLVRRLIPRHLSSFRKIRSGEPYLFDRWDFDEEGRFCFYYIVTGGKKESKKRVLMEELVKAVS